MFKYISSDTEHITIECSNCANQRRIRTEKLDRKKITNKAFTLEKGVKCINCQLIHDTITDIQPYKAPAPISTHVNPFQVFQDEIDRINDEKAKPPCCPKCSSTFLQIDKRGFGYGKSVIGGLLLGPLGLFAGGIGAKKTIVQCGKCGHKWTP